MVADLFGKRKNGYGSSNSKGRLVAKADEISVGYSSSNGDYNSRGGKSEREQSRARKRSERAVSGLDGRKHEMITGRVEVWVGEWEWLFESSGSLPGDAVGSGGRSPVAGGGEKG